MRVRHAHQEDLERIVDIYNSSIESRLATADTSPITVESRQGWFNSHDSTRPLLVCEMPDPSSGEILMVGWLSLTSFNPKPAYHPTVECSIYISQQHLGTGIGKYLLSEAMDSLPKLGIHRVICKIFSHNTASLSLFKKFGFEFWGELPDVCEMDGESYSVTILGYKTP